MPIHPVKNAADALAVLRPGFDRLHTTGQAKRREGRGKPFGRTPTRTGDQAHAARLEQFCQQAGYQGHQPALVENVRAQDHGAESGTGGGKRDRCDIACGKRGACGKRDGYDIDKMGSFGLCFGYATNSGVAPGGMVFHVLNRGVARMQLFEKAADYQAFEQVLQDTLNQSPMRICAYAVMPNHWHLLLWPECDGELAAFMQRLTITHVRRWQEHRGYAGLGHVYQG